MSSNLIDIRGIDKRGLLISLWVGSKPRPTPGLNKIELHEALARKGYIDSLGGRPIKLNIFKDFIDPSTHDSYAGAGKCQLAVNCCRGIGPMVRTDIP